MNSCGLDGDISVAAAKAPARVTMLPPGTDRAALWIEPAVADAPQSWSDRARSVCLITPPSAFLLDERVFARASRRKTIASISSTSPAWRISSRRSKIIC
jgi:hypothetical protein